MHACPSFNEEALDLGGSLANHTDVVLSPLRGEVVRFANLPNPPPNAFSASDKALQKHVDREHNCSLMSITNEPWYGVVACCDIRAGDVLKTHYGPASCQLLRQAAKNYNTA